MRIFLHNFLSIRLVFGEQHLKHTGLELTNSESGFIPARDRN